LQILFEDDDLLVLDKAAGMVVHPGAGNQEHTLVNALLSHCTTLSGIGGKERPGIVHRLDKETSGCLVVAKNDIAHRELSRQFAARTLKKVYLALVSGRVKNPAGFVDAPIERHPGSPTAHGCVEDAARALSAHGVSRVGVGRRDEPRRVHAPQWPHASNPCAHAPPRASPARRQSIWGESVESIRASDVACLEAGLHASESGDWREFEAPVPADFNEALGRLGLAV
jgi:23S rRNA pseudouridine1911/1915/1917 synthase